MFCHSCEMWEEPRVLLQYASLQPHVPLPVRTWSPLWAGWCACWGLRLSGGNSPEPRIHLHPKSRLCLPLLWRHNTTRTCCYWWATVVSWSEYWHTIYIEIVLVLFNFLVVVLKHVYCACNENACQTKSRVSCSFCENGELRCSKDCGKDLFKFCNASHYVTYMQLNSDILYIPCEFNDCMHQAAEMERSVFIVPSTQWTRLRKLVTVSANRW